MSRFIEILNRKVKDGLLINLKDDFFYRIKQDSLAKLKEEADFEILVTEIYL